MEVLRRLTPLLEQISIDEAFLDLSELPEDAETIAHRVQQEINETLGLPCSIGVASNKLVAKIATDAGKAASAQAGGAAPPRPMPSPSCQPGRRPNSWRRCPPRRCGAWDPRRLNDWRNWACTPSARSPAWPADDLIRRFGKHGAELSRHAHGISDTPIITEHEAKSVSQETTFAARHQRPRAPEEYAARAFGEGGRAPAQRQSAGAHGQAKAALERLHHVDQADDAAPHPLTRTRRSIRQHWVCSRGSGNPQDMCACWALESAILLNPLLASSACGISSRQTTSACRQVLEELQARYGRRVIYQGKIK